MQNLVQVQNCAKRIAAELPDGFIPAVGLVLGTGLGNLCAPVERVAVVSYASLPDFPQSTVLSHAGQFFAGYLQGVPVIIQQGRCHLYEGYSPADVCMGVRVMAELGIRSLILTNAAGAINPHFTAGSLMLIDDHINGTGRSPLTGPNQESWGLRFPDMSRVYDESYIQLAEKTSLSLGIRLEKGVYYCTPGPQLETRAETRAYRHMGADAVGMSTVLEAIAAHHMGVRILGISCLTNKNLPDCMDEASIEDIIAVAEKAGRYACSLIEALIPQLATV